MTTMREEPAQAPQCGGNPSLDCATPTECDRRGCARLRGDAQDEARPGAGGGADDLRCPECGAGARRPKCMWELGPECPRHEVIAASRSSSPAEEQDEDAFCANCGGTKRSHRRERLGLRCVPGRDSWFRPRAEAPAPAAGVWFNRAAADAYTDGGVSDLTDEERVRFAKAVLARLAPDAPGAADARAREDADLLDEADRREWLIEPQMGGGWVVSTAEAATDAGDADVVMLASTRGSLRDALRAARRAAGEGA